MRVREGLQRLGERAAQPVDGASIALFRFLFGAILVWETARFFLFGWILPDYIEPAFLFTYHGFDWVKPLAGNGCYLHFSGVGLLAACVALGVGYRITAPLLFVGFTWWYLLDEAQYLNHLYLTCLLCFLFILIPAHRTWSLDGWLNPINQEGTVPAWCLWLLRFQLGVVYVYAGIAKLNADWLAGAPIRDWLAGRADYPLLGPRLATESATWFFAYGGLLFDLLVVPFLLWRKTRAWAFAAALFFHLMNKYLFSIGIFPEMMIAATTLFFTPDWPRRFLRRNVPAPKATGARLQPLLGLFLVVYVVVQLLVPLRHHLYPGPVAWTEEGHRFSWRMKLRQKRAYAVFLVTETTTGESWEFPAADHLTERQLKRVGRWPDMCLQFARYIAELEAQQGREVEVRVESWASLNNRTPELLIDPLHDLSKERRSLNPAPWILPMTQPLPKPSTR